MSGTSASNASTLPSDAPSSVKCPTITTEKQFASDSPSSTPRSLPIGQVLRKACSLENPFYAISYASFTSFHAHDPSRRHPNDLLKETGKYLRNWYSWTSCSKEDSTELKFRPVIRAPVPTWAEGEERNLSWVFLMGTMSGHTQETLPESLKRFAIPLQSSNTVGESESGASDSVSIRTTPPWKLKKGKKQCWIIGIPVGMPAAEAPTESWCDHTDYSLDPEEMEKLTTTSDKMIVEFSAMSQDIHLFDKFVWDLRTSKDKLKQSASPNKNATNKVSVSPTSAKSSRVPSTPASPTPTKSRTTDRKTESKPLATMTPCNLSKRRRQADGDDELEPSASGDKNRKQKQESPSSGPPLRSSKRLCTINGRKSQSSVTALKTVK